MEFLINTFIRIIILFIKLKRTPCVISVFRPCLLAGIFYIYILTKGTNHENMY
ncbi:hypothetical protein [Salmonella phage SD-1_S14]|nr:hypothetical protein [Salmonella phage SD-2_S15]WPK18929.1 hypothetical protein [Salmonella phage SD-6_S16]WPK19601.1 hypothetical protein [Salmonella phage SD-1_S14]WPK20623.1 hypothetical protein [Salmonella phage SD-15_S21]